MPTRLYLHASGSVPSANNPAFDGAWEQTGQAVRLPMDVKTKLSVATTLANASAITVPITTTQQYLGAQFISRQVFRPARIDASVTFSMVLRGLENATTDNVFLAYVLKAVSADGLRTIGTLASSMTNAGTEFVATAATRIFSAIALTALTITEPWRLVIEIGGHGQAPGTAGSYTYRYGCSAATDFALTSALTTDLNPWIELSANLGAATNPNLRGVTVGDGASTWA